MRPDPLSEAAARRHELTRAKAIQALRELDRAGTPVTFSAVASAARISRSWLYTQPDISDQIRRLRRETDRRRLRRRHSCRPAGHRRVATRQAHRCPRPEPAAHRREHPAPPPARPRTRRTAVLPDPIRQRSGPVKPDLAHNRGLSAAASLPPAGSWLSAGKPAHQTRVEDWPGCPVCADGEDGTG